jgi:hypothetical protein
LLKKIGLTEITYQENRRREYEHQGIVFGIDWWPKLSRYLEIEGDSEEAIGLVRSDRSKNLQGGSVQKRDRAFLERAKELIDSGKRCVFLKKFLHRFIKGF